MDKLRQTALKTRVACTALGLKDRPAGSDWVPGTAGNTTSTVDITISCRNLLNKDLLSKSDPTCFVFGRPPGSRRWVQLMRTEVIDDDLNPDFTEQHRMEYSFEKVQQLRFEVYDVDSPKIAKLSAQDTLGYVETSLGGIVTGGPDGLALELNGISSPPGQKSPTIILYAEEVASEKEEVLLKLTGVSCGKWNGCFPPKLFFVAYKLNEGGRYVATYRSKPARGMSPSWAQMQLSLHRLCNGDHEKEIKFEVYQLAVRQSAGVIHVGSALTTLAKLLTIGQEKIPIMSPKGKPTSASIKVVSCTISPIDTFMEYIQAGMQIQCSFGIDFTASNGEPSDSISLHYTSQVVSQPNVYEQAIFAVGTILKDYDTDGTFSAYGFGARLPPKGDPSHFFNVTLAKSPHCGSVPGVLDSYRACIRKIVLFGPTNFAPTINHVAKQASKVKNGELYHVLTIVTDGVITDMSKTKKAIVEASAFPMSIIIIGVGEADFDAMEELDGDAVRVSYRGKYAQRDIVQFVAYRSARAWMGCTGEFTLSDLPEIDTEDAEDSQPAEATFDSDEESKADGDGEEYNPNDSHDEEEEPEAAEEKDEKFNRLANGALAKEVLAEIPNQIRAYMIAKGIKPNMIPKKTAQKDSAPDGGKGAEGGEKAAAEGAT